MMYKRTIRWWAVSLSVPLGLIAIRMCVTHSLTYAFYYWNLFLAVVPLVASACLDARASLWSARNLMSLGMWFCFLPNAPYLITDIIHFQEGPRGPAYLDMAIVYTMAWNGVLLAYASARRVEEWLLERYTARPVRIAVIAAFLLCGFGIYLGRYLRWNSWDILVHPFTLGKDIGVRVLFPYRYKQTWAVTLLFGVLLSVGYAAFRSQAPGRSTV